MVGRCVGAQVGVEQGYVQLEQVQEPEPEPALHADADADVDAEGEEDTEVFSSMPITLTLQLIPPLFRHIAHIRR